MTKTFLKLHTTYWRETERGGEQTIELNQRQKKLIYETNKQTTTAKLSNKINQFKTQMKIKQIYAYSYSKWHN